MAREGNVYRLPGDLFVKVRDENTIKLYQTTNNTPNEPRETFEVLISLSDFFGLFKFLESIFEGKDDMNTNETNDTTESGAADETTEITVTADTAVDAGTQVDTAVAEEAAETTESTEPLTEAPLVAEGEDTTDGAAV